MLNRDNLKEYISCIALKLCGLAELLEMTSGDPPMSNTGFKGISFFLSDLSEELTEISKSMND